MTLQGLIAARRTERGWSYADLEHRAGGKLSKSRWQQLGTGARITEFPEPATLEVMAEVLEVETTTILLSAATTIGMVVRRRGPHLADLMPAGTDRLSPRMRDAILAIIRAAVAESLNLDETGGLGADVTLEWQPPDHQRRNASPRTGDHRA